jgi:hypothetical protein
MCVVGPVRGVVRGFRLALGHAELIHHLLGHFSERAKFRVHQNVSLAIKLFAFAEKFTDSCNGVNVLQQRPVALALHTVEDFFRGSPKADDKRVRFERCDIPLVGRKTAARGNHGPFTATQFLHNPGLHLSKRGLALMFKNILDARASAADDNVVRIKEGVVERVRDKPSNRRFACPHEADQRQVPYVPGRVHNILYPIFVQNAREMRGQSRC